MDSYANLSRFLGVDLKPPEFDVVRNASLQKGDLDESLAVEAAKFYADTYEFVFKRFGPSVKDLWGGYNHLGM